MFVKKFGRTARPVGLPAAAVVVAPPWASCGSTHLFAAQVTFYIAAGRKVMLHLGPTNDWHCASRSEFWAETTADMSVDGVAAVTYSRLSPYAWRQIVRRSIDKLKPGASEIMQMAKTAATAQMPVELSEFIRSNSIEIVHVNHAFEMLLGLAIANLVFITHGFKPVIICESHDIQTVCRRLNSIPAETIGRIRRDEQGETDEETLYASADLLVHCSQNDMNFFQNRMPASRHWLQNPTLSTTIEQRLKSLCAPGTGKTFDFLYVGAYNVANYNGICWLLEQVVPLLEKTYSFAFAGRIGELVATRSPHLAKRHAGSFIGRVPDIARYYDDSRVVLIPSFEGTGTSIKLIEALCAGNPIIATSNALRGMPDEVQGSSGLICRDDPIQFAKAMEHAVKTEGGSHEANRLVYDEHFSNKNYFKRMEALIIEMTSCRDVRLFPNSTHSEIADASETRSSAGGRSQRC